MAAHAGLAARQGSTSGHPAPGSTGCLGVEVTAPPIYTREGDLNPDLTATPAPQVATLMTMGTEILVRLNQLAGGAGMDLPTRQFVYPTMVPADCEQVVVVIGGWSLSPVPSGMTDCLTAKWVGQFGVGITRCSPAVPSKNVPIPRPDQMNAAAQVASDDAELLLQLVSVLGEMGPETAVLTQEPDGGFQSVTLTVSLPAFGGLD